MINNESIIYFSRLGLIMASKKTKNEWNIKTFCIKIKAYNKEEVIDYLMNRNNLEDVLVEEEE